MKKKAELHFTPFDDWLLEEMYLSFRCLCGAFLDIDNGLETTCEQCGRVYRANIYVGVGNEPLTDPIQVEK